MKYFLIKINIITYKVNRSCRIVHVALWSYEIGMGEQSPIPNFLRLEVTARLIYCSTGKQYGDYFCFNYSKTKLSTNSADSSLIVATCTALETVIVLLSYCSPIFFILQFALKCSSHGLCKLLFSYLEHCQ